MTEGRKGSLSPRALAVLGRGFNQALWCIRSFLDPRDMWFAFRSMLYWHLLGRRGGATGAHRDLYLRTGCKFRIRPWTSDFEVLRKVLLGDQYAAVLGRLPENPLVLDLGANIGASACLFLEHSKDAVVVAVEPDQENVKLLEFNVRRYGDRCLVQCCAAAGEGGFARADSADQPWAHRFVGVVGSRDTLLDDNSIRARSVSEILEAAGLGDRIIDLVKCDIECAERDLFKHASASQWLSRVRWLSVELHAGYSIDEFMIDLRRHGCAPTLIEARVLGGDAELTIQLSAARES